VSAEDDDKLRIDDLVPAAGGEWYGLLFANPSQQRDPHLTWCFRFPFEDVSREDEYSPLSPNLEWLPVPADGWRRIAGRHVTSASFGEPGEASVYYYLHHRFEMIDLQLIEQHGRTLRAVATVSGDVDGLGVDPVRVDAWLTFTGILVSLDDETLPDVALARLGQFTDTSDLTLASDRGDTALRFVPQPG
jgi:hypothetical protein